MYKRASEIGTLSAGMLIHWGSLLESERKDLQSALQKYKLAEAAAPNNVEVLHTLATMLHKRMRRPDEAMSIYRRAIVVCADQEACGAASSAGHASSSHYDCSNRRCDLLVGYGDILQLHYRDFEAAESAYLSALELQHDHVDALIGLARVLKATGESQAAVTGSARWVPSQDSVTKPPVGVACTPFGAMESQRDAMSSTAAMRSVLERLVRAGVRDMWVWLEYGRGLLAEGHNERAQTAFQRVVDVTDANKISSAEYLGALKGLATIDARAGMWEDAKSKLERVLGIDPAETASNVELARVLVAMGGSAESQRAERILSSVLSKSPTHANALLCMARIRANRGQVSAALSTYAKVLDTNGCLQEAQEGMREMRRRMAACAVATKATMSALRTHTVLAWFEKHDLWGKIARRVKEEQLSKCFAFLCSWNTAVNSPKKRDSKALTDANMHAPVVTTENLNMPATARESVHVPDLSFDDVLVPELRHPASVSRMSSGSTYALQPLRKPHSSQGGQTKFDQSGSVRAPCVDSGKRPQQRSDALIDDLLESFVENNRVPSRMRVVNELSDMFCRHDSNMLFDSCRCDRRGNREYNGMHDIALTDCSYVDDREDSELLLDSVVGSENNAHKPAAAIRSLDCQHDCKSEVLAKPNMEGQAEPVRDVGLAGSCETVATSDKDSPNNYQPDTTSISSLSCVRHVDGIRGHVEGDCKTNDLGTIAHGACTEAELRMLAATSPDRPIMLSECADERANHGAQITQECAQQGGSTIMDERVGTLDVSGIRGQQPMADSPHAIYGASACADALDVSKDAGSLEGPYSACTPGQQHSQSMSALTPRNHQVQSRMFDESKDSQLTLTHRSTPRTPETPESRHSSWQDTNQEDKAAGQKAHHAVPTWQGTPQNTGTLHATPSSIAQSSHSRMPQQLSASQTGVCRQYEQESMDADQRACMSEYATPQASASRAASRELASRSVNRLDLESATSGTLHHHVDTTYSSDGVHSHAFSQASSPVASLPPGNRLENGVLDGHVFGTPVVADDAQATPRMDQGMLNTPIKTATPAAHNTPHSRAYVLGDGQYGEPAAASRESFTPLPPNTPNLPRSPITVRCLQNGGIDQFRRPRLSATALQVLRDSSQIDSDRQTPRHSMRAQSPAEPVNNDDLAGSSPSSSATVSLSPAEMMASSAARIKHDQQLRRLLAVANAPATESPGTTESPSHFTNSRSASYDSQPAATHYHLAHTSASRESLKSAAYLSRFEGWSSQSPDGKSTASGYVAAPPDSDTESAPLSASAEGEERDVGAGHTQDQDSGSKRIRGEEVLIDMCPVLEGDVDMHDDDAREVVGRRTACSPHRHTTVRATPSRRGQSLFEDMDPEAAESQPTGDASDRESSWADFQRADSSRRDALARILTPSKLQQGTFTPGETAQSRGHQPAGASKLDTACESFDSDSVNMGGWKAINADDAERSSMTPVCDSESTLLAHSQSPGDSSIQPPSLLRDQAHRAWQAAEETNRLRGMDTPPQDTRSLEPFIDDDMHVPAVKRAPSLQQSQQDPQMTEHTVAGDSPADASQMLQGDQLISRMMVGLLCAHVHVVCAGALAAAELMSKRVPLSCETAVISCAAATSPDLSSSKQESHVDASNGQAASPGKTRRESSSVDMAKSQAFSDQGATGEEDKDHLEATPPDASRASGGSGIMGMFSDAMHRAKQMCMPWTVAQEAPKYPDDGMALKGLGVQQGKEAYARDGRMNLEGNWRGGPAIEATTWHAALASSNDGDKLQVDGAPEEHVPSVPGGRILHDHSGEQAMIDNKKEGIADVHAAPGVVEYTATRGVAFRTDCSRSDKYTITDSTGRKLGVRHGERILASLPNDGGFVRVCDAKWAHVKSGLYMPVKTVTGEALLVETSKLKRVQHTPPKTDPASMDTEASSAMWMKKTRVANLADATSVDDFVQDDKEVYDVHTAGAGACGGQEDEASELAKPPQSASQGHAEYIHGAQAGDSTEETTRWTFEKPGEAGAGLEATPRYVGGHLADDCGQACSGGDTSPMSVRESLEGTNDESQVPATPVMRNMPNVEQFSAMASPPLQLLDSSQARDASQPCVSSATPRGMLMDSNRRGEESSVTAQVAPDHEQPLSSLNPNTPRYALVDSSEVQESVRTGQVALDDDGQDMLFLSAGSPRRVLIDSSEDFERQTLEGDVTMELDMCTDLLQQERETPREKNSALVAADEGDVTINLETYGDSVAACSVRQAQDQADDQAAYAGCTDSLSSTGDTDGQPAAKIEGSLRSYAGLTEDEREVRNQKYDLANSLADEGRMEDAVTMYEELLEQIPDDADVS